MIQANCCNRYQAPSIFLDLRKYLAQEVAAQLRCPCHSADQLYHLHKVLPDVYSFGQR
ncbi:hypothetical protein PALA111701_18080 [Paenibacillus lactis]|uniref:Uncharacterized protein n=2 Tax=Paenibacillus lactis TaxID=228574 RepID=G4HKT9_9BACL|nr:hypothetical protein PaelaDRAFT_4600 [Paenibacillus lactis 154]MBP1896140.1 hypothetical protein [Paenibacillus lactis]